MAYSEEVAYSVHLSPGSVYSSIWVNCKVTLPSTHMAMTTAGRKGGGRAVVSCMRGACASPGTQMQDTSPGVLHELVC